MSSRLLALGLVLLASPAFAPLAYGQAVQPGWVLDPKTNCKIWNAFPVSNEQITWSGGCKDGMADGKGKMRWILAGKPARNKEFEGEMKEGRFNGQGKLITIEGDVYEGQFKDGERSGRGKMVWINRNSYDGEWKNGVMEGRGLYRWLGGNSYNGEWKGGKQNGRGLFKFLNGNSYEGEYKDGIANGRGRFRWANGDVYDGGWKMELPDGIGTLKIYSNDEMITGNWRQGCLRTPDGRMLGAIKTELECSIEEKNAPKN